MMKKTSLLFILLGIVSGLFAGQAEVPRYINLVYIGNSISQGVIIENPRVNAPPAQATAYLRAQSDFTKVKYSNQGVSGMTTVDFLPETKTLFRKVLDAADEFSIDTWAQLVFSIMLGTNDSAIKGPNGAPVSPEQYHANMKTITDELLRRYPKSLVVYHRPIWYSPNTHNGATYLEEGLNRLNTYLPELRKLVEEYGQTHPGRVFMGDTDAYDYFKENHKDKLIPEEGRSGIFYLHPNVEGAADLGRFWGKALYRILKEKR